MQIVMPGARSQTQDPRVAQRGPAEAPLPHRFRFLLLDLAVIIALALFSLAVRWDATRGDLWLDEADYAGQPYRPAGEC
jgi:hypothetical protein